eukprot:SAG31_NODE_25529_length_459_cov_1.450000_1_plen_65_part_00
MVPAPVVLNLVPELNLIVQLYPGTAVLGYSSTGTAFPLEGQAAVEHLVTDPTSNRDRPDLNLQY